MVLSRPTALVRSPRALKSGVVESAVGTVGRTVLVEVVRVEHLAWRERVETLLHSFRLVGKVLLPCVVGTDLSVEGTGDEFAAHPVLRSVDGLLATRATGAPRGAA